MLLKRPLIAVFLSAGLLGVSLTSQAALFDDKEARKKILQVEEKSLANDSEHQAAIESLKERIATMENMLQNGGLVDLQNEVETLKQEVAQLKGDLEVANYTIQNMQKRQKDLYADTDTRLRRIEANAVSNDAAAAGGQGEEGMEELNQIGTANAAFENAQYKDAFAGYDSFLKNFPGSQYEADAMYGLGYSQYALKNYKSAIATQEKFLAKYADHAKAPDAMYNLANSQIQLGRITSAKKTLNSLIKAHPDAAITPSAKKRLKALSAL